MIRKKTRLRSKSSDETKFAEPVARQKPHKQKRSSRQKSRRACAMSSRHDSESDCGSSSSEEDVDSGIADEPASEGKKDTDCMDLSEFFTYWWVRSFF